MNESPTILAVITARGGSKGIPRKNLTSLGGRPLIAWSIEAALGASSLSRVIVSTEDREIADVAEKWGAEVPFLRPSELAGDGSPHIPVVIHAAERMESIEGLIPDYLLLLQPTTPLRSKEDIDNAVRLITKKKGDSVVSVCEAASHPYLIKTMTPDGRLEDYASAPDRYLARQSLPPVYALNGAIYLVRREVLLKRKTFQTERTFGYVMPPERSMDIDTPWDLYLVDLILRDRNGRKSY